MKRSVTLRSRSASSVRRCEERLGDFVINFLALLPLRPDFAGGGSDRQAERLIRRPQVACIPVGPTFVLYEGAVVLFHHPLVFDHHPVMEFVGRARVALGTRAGVSCCTWRWPRAPRSASLR
jgi:hypothetical protein